MWGQGGEEGRGGRRCYWEESSVCSTLLTNTLIQNKKNDYMSTILDNVHCLQYKDILRIVHLKSSEVQLSGECNRGWETEREREK